MKRIKRWTAMAVAVLLLTPFAGSTAEVTAEKTENRGKVTEITWKDENGTAAPGPEGYAVIRYTYKGQDTTEQYFDADGEPFQTGGGYYGRIVTKDGRNNISAVSYIGKNGELTVNSLGYAKVLYKYFTSKEEREVIYCGADGKTPVTVPSLGYAQMETKHRGNAFIGRVYKDPKGNPVDIPAGYASFEIQLAKKTGAPIRSWYEHADGTPANGPDGWAVCRMERDDKGRLLKTEYFDAQENVTQQGGYAAETYRYGRDGSFTVTRFDTAGNRIPFDGEAVSVRRVMKGEKVTEETFLDDEGEPVAASGGYVTVSYSYDSNGNLEMTQYRDGNGNKTTCKQGYSAILETRNEQGQLISRKLLDISGQPVNNNTTGICEERYEYDETGRLKEIQRFDATGNKLTGRN